ncbi:MAG TPA: hypothetical protein VMB73_19970 [Acetobacteraceae bacterium]|nr:hypothetical protein [Acetobacteraceae bacterium]
MKTLRNTLLGACLALPLLAATGQAQTILTQSRTITVPPGAVVVILPGPGTVAMPGRPVTAAPAAVPVMQLIAQQQAAMQRMMARMNAMFPPMPPMPDPAQMFRAAFGAGGPMPTLAGGPGVCSESISIVQRGNAAPVITRTASAACGTPAGNVPHSIDQMRPVAPVAPARGPKVLEVSNPPQTIANVPPHA